MTDSRPENSPGLISRCFDSLAQLAAAVIVAAALFLAGKFYLVDKIDEEIRGRVETTLSQQYPGLHVSVSSARRLEGEGIEVRGLMIREGGDRSAAVILSIEHLFVACETKLPDMVTQPLQFRRAEVRGVRIRAERKASGTWNVQHLLPMPTSHGSAFPVVVDDLAIEIIDPVRTPQAGLTLRDIHLTLTPQSAGEAFADKAASARTILKGRGTGDHFEKIDFQGYCDKATGEWSLTGAVEGLEFTPRLRAALPTDCDRWIAPLASVRGRTQFGFRIVRKPNGVNKQPTYDFLVVGDVSEGRIDDDRLPEPLTDVSASVRVDPSGLRIENLTGRCGPAEIWADLTTHGFTLQSPLELQLNLDGWPLDRLLDMMLANRASEELEKLSLHGVADVAGKFTYDGKVWTHQAEAKLRQVNLLYAAFPYPLSDGEGRIIGKGDRIRAELQAFAGSEPISIVGEVPARGRQGASWIEVRTLNPLPIDARLIAACEPAAQEIVKAFHPRGSISFAGRMERNTPTDPVSKLWRIDMHDLSIRHDQFAYPIDQVRGSLAYDNGYWTFVDLTGRNGSGYITADGSFTPGKGNSPGRCDLHFNASDVPLDDDLRKAITPAGQKLWSQLRPRGTLDQLVVDLSFEANKPESISLTMHGQKWPPQQNLDGRTISLEPQLMPYRLDNVTGEFNYHNGIVELKDLQASHGRAIFSLAGDFKPNDRGGWLLRFTRLFIDRLNIDRELWEALPPDWSASAGRLRLEGPVGVLGTLSINLNDDVAPPEERFLIDWDLELDLEDGKIDPGTALEHVYGGVRLVGRGGPTGFASRGELKIDSFLAHGVQFSKVEGPFAFDNRRLLVGEWAEANIRGRVPRAVKAKVFDGEAILNASLNLDQEGAFAVQAALTEANLWNITLETMPERAGMSGKAYGTLALQGTTRGMHTWAGNGAIRLRDANIYEVPVFLAVLRLLSVRRQDNLVFSDANMDFRIAGDDLQFDRLDFHSELVSLKGRGHMTMTGQHPVDLQFYTQMGRDELQVPILRPILGEASRSFLLIEVNGAAENPNVTKKAFPAINDQLRQLFPDLAEGPRPDDPVSRPSLLRRR